jgi:hypothetical protein
MVSGWEVDGRSSETWEGEGERHGSGRRFGESHELAMCFGDKLSFFRLMFASVP